MSALTALKELVRQPIAAEYALVLDGVTLHVVPTLDRALRAAAQVRGVRVEVYR